MKQIENKIIETFNENLFIVKEKDGYRVLVREGHENSSMGILKEFYFSKENGDEDPLKEAYGLLHLQFFICDKCKYHKFFSPEEMVELMKNNYNYVCQCGKQGTIKRLIISKGEIKSGNLTFENDV